MTNKATAKRKPAAKALGPLMTASAAFKMAIKGDDDLISRSSWYAGLRNGQIPRIKVGRRYLIPTAAFLAWLEGVGVKAA